jgi:hypothetical protein
MIPDQAKGCNHAVCRKHAQAVVLREIWYSHYMIRICKVERDYGWPDWARE